MWTPSFVKLPFTSRVRTTESVPCAARACTSSLARGAVSPAASAVRFPTGFPPNFIRLLSWHGTASAVTFCSGSQWNLIGFADPFFTHFSVSRSDREAFQLTDASGSTETVCGQLAAISWWIFSPRWIRRTCRVAPRAPTDPRRTPRRTSVRTKWHSPSRHPPRSGSSPSPPRASRAPPRAAPRRSRARDRNRRRQMSMTCNPSSSTPRRRS